MSGIKSGKTKIYFVGSIINSAEYRSNYNLIVDLINNMDVELWTILDKLTPEELKKYTDEDHKKHLRRSLKQIKENDIFIAEVSSSSTTIQTPYVST